LGVFLHFQRSDEFSKSDMLNLAIEHFANDTREGGHPIAGPVQPPREFPFSRALAAVFAPGEALFSEMRWRAVHGFLNREAVAYDLVSRRGVSATVYVATCSVDGLTRRFRSDRCSRPGRVPPRLGKKATGCTFWWWMAASRTTSDSLQRLAAP
jgi:hypothetical protein